MTAIQTATGIRAGAACAILAALVATSGCGDPARLGSELAERWNFRGDTDDGSPGAPKPDATPSTEVSLHLENGSESPIYVQVARSDCTGRPSWFRIEVGDRPLKLWRRCGECICHDVRQGACPAEPCPASCAVGQVRRIETGAVIEHRWDGRYWESNRRNGTDCLRETAPTAGARLDVEYCWGRGVAREHGEPTITGKTCRSVTFVYGEVSAVTYRVE